MFTLMKIQFHRTSQVQMDRQMVTRNQLKSNSAESVDIYGDIHEHLQGTYEFQQGNWSVSLSDGPFLVG